MKRTRKILAVAVLALLGQNAFAQPGSACGAASAPFGDHWEALTNGWNWYFEGQAIPQTGNNAVGLGYTACTTALPAKLSVLQGVPSVNLSTIAGQFINRDVATVPGLTFIGARGTAEGIQTSTVITNVGGEFFARSAPTTIGVRGGVQTTISSSLGYGGKFAATTTTTVNALYGVHGMANSSFSGLNYGTYGQATGTGATTGNYGAYGTASGSPTNWGTYGTASGGANNFGSYGAAPGTGTNNYGMYATATGAATTNYGIYATASGGTFNYAGYFNHDVYVNGPTSGTGYLLASDERLKTDVKDIPNALELIGRFKPKTYSFIKENPYGMNLPTEKQYGFLAQEVEDVLPELVKITHKPEGMDAEGNKTTESFDYKAVNYTEFIPLLVQGMQEQQKEIEELKAMVESLVKNNNANTLNVQTATLSDKNSIVLDQNVPNPFAESTTITFVLPENMQKAQMLFYNSAGKLIQSVDLNQKGNGQLTVFANDLSTGIYTYTLVVDGQIISTKKMIKE